MTRRNLRDRWLPHVLAGSGGADYGCRLMLTLMHGRMTAKGYVSIPRTELADILGVHPSQITRWTSEAVRAGLLERVGGGYHGRTAEYCAVIPPTKVSSGVSPSPPKVRVIESPLVSPFESGRNGHEGERWCITQHARVTYVSESNAPNSDVGGARDDVGKSRTEGEQVIYRSLAALSPWARLAYPLRARPA
jgi:hypothetical protein